MASKKKRKNKKKNSNYNKQKVIKNELKKEEIIEETASKEEIDSKIHDVIQNYDASEIENKEIVDTKINSSLDKKIHDSIVNYDKEEQVEVHKEKTLDEKIHDSIQNYENGVDNTLSYDSQEVNDLVRNEDTIRLDTSIKDLSNSSVDSSQTQVMDSVKISHEDTENQKEESKEDKKEEPKEEVKEEQKEEAKEEPKEEKASTADDEKPEYVKEMLDKKNKRAKLLVVCVVVLIIGVLFSTMFAVTRANNETIVAKTKIKDIDVAELSMDDAKKVLTEKLENELKNDIELKYGEDYSITINPEQIEYKYDINEAISKAYGIGRDGNIVENNYEILGNLLFGNEIDIDYTYNEESLTKIIDDINSKIPGVVVEPTYYIEEDSLIVEKGKDGIQVKKEELKNEVLQKIKERLFEETSKEGFSQKIDIPVEDTKAEKIDMAKIYEEVHCEPKDAYFTTEPYNIYPDTDGIDFASPVEETQKTVDSEDKEEYTFKLKISKASKTISDLGMEAFPYEISRFSTKYDASNVNRSTNLAIAAGKINGKVLLPGEEFSYNKVVGKRTVEEGYKDAKIYADGGVVDGLAGGICQISSTLYNAALLANLEITERRNHSYPTSYLPVGRDATVVYGVIDLKFKNTRKYPIKIEASVKNGVATFVIHGIKEEKEYDIKLIPVTTATLGFGTQTVSDPSLPAGHQVVKQAGHAGYKVTTYIEKTCGDEYSKEVLSNDTYQPMAKIIRVGAGGAPAATPGP